MSMDTMQAHDDGLEEARRIVLRYMKETCGEADCKICPVIRKKRHRILAALSRARKTR